MSLFRRGAANGPNDVHVPAARTPASAAVSDLAGKIRAALAESDESLTRATALELVCQATGWPVGHAWVRLDGSWRTGHDWFDTDADRFAELRAVTEACDLGPGRGVVAAVLHLEATRFLGDLAGLGSDQRRATAEAARLHSMVGVPVTADDQVVAVLEFLCEYAVPADDEVADALREVALRVSAVATKPAKPAKVQMAAAG